MKCYLSIAIAVLTLSLSPISYAQELPPIGETSITHGYELVGVIDGCRVWKIDYWGSHIYVTRCPGTGEKVSQSQWRKGCGKGCTKIVTTSSDNE